VKQQIVFLLIKKEHVVYQTVYALTCRQMNVLTKVANCSPIGVVWRWSVKMAQYKLHGDYYPIDEEFYCLSAVLLIPELN
jgi:hypothetical protein